MHDRAITQWAFGWPVAMLAVLCQIAALLLPMPSARAAPAFAGYGVICHAGDGAPAQDPAPLHAADCVLCSHCLVTAAPALAPVPPALPQPGAWQASAAMAPAPDRAAILRRRSTAQPRGPPAPV